jgi:N-acetylneuraminate synthase
MNSLVRDFTIGARRVGSKHSCFVVAEAGVNHNGELQKALEMVDVAASAGADAIKYQTFQADELASPEAPKAGYQAEATGSKESQLEMLRRLQLAPDAHRALLARCQQRGIQFLSSPFDEASADFLEELGVPAFKVPSGELTNLPFLRYLAQKGRPLIVSTGMSDMGEVAAAVAAVREAGGRDLALLQCVSRYPADPTEANLKAMATLRERFGVPVGFSDHTLGVEVSLAAVALGAAVIEKHFTLNRRLPGPDHAASLEPPELELLVRGIRTVEAALGSGEKVPAPAEQETARVARKSLVAVRDIPAGTTLAQEHIAVRRPGTGLPPSQLPAVLGRRTCVPVSAGAVITLEMLS